MGLTALTFAWLVHCILHVHTLLGIQSVLIQSSYVIKLLSWSFLNAAPHIDRSVVSTLVSCCQWKGLSWTPCVENPGHADSACHAYSPSISILPLRDSCVSRFPAVIDLPKVSRVSLHAEPPSSSALYPDSHLLCHFLSPKWLPIFVSPSLGEYPYLLIFYWFQGFVSPLMHAKLSASVPRASSCKKLPSLPINPHRVLRWHLFTSHRRGLHYKPSKQPLP